MLSQTRTRAQHRSSSHCTLRIRITACCMVLGDMRSCGGAELHALAGVGSGRLDLCSAVCSACHRRTHEDPLRRLALCNVNAIRRSFAGFGRRNKRCARRSAFRCGSVTRHEVTAFKPHTTSRACVFGCSDAPSLPPTSAHGHTGQPAVLPCSLAASAVHAVRSFAVVARGRREALHGGQASGKRRATVRATVLRVGRRARMPAPGPEQTAQGRESSVSFARSGHSARADAGHLRDRRTGAGPLPACRHCKRMQAIRASRGKREDRTHARSAVRRGSEGAVLGAREMGAARLRRAGRGAIFQREGRISELHGTLRAWK